MSAHTLSDADVQLLQHDIDALKDRPGALLPILHAIQDRFGHIPPAAIPVIANALRHTRADIHGVISFYHHFRQTAPGAHVVQICRAEACQSLGARALEQHARTALGVDFGETTGDRQITLEPVYCLGNCACGPSVRIGNDIYGHVTPGVFDDLVSGLHTRPVTVQPGPPSLQAPPRPSSTSQLAALSPESVDATPAPRIYVPNDTTALALGADLVAARLQYALGDGVELVRNGSRGLFWLEPLIEVETAQGRVGYGPVRPDDVPALLNAGLLQGEVGHPLALGPVEDIPQLRRQQRVTFARAGIVDPTSIDGYRKLDGFAGLERALSLTPQAIVDEIVASGLRGRGGAAFPTGIKWQTVLDAPATRKYIVCNADEGDSGAFADRMVMECDPYMLIEGMIIAGLAVGATQGYIYLRSEYPVAWRRLNDAIERARQAGYLGNIAGSGRAFELEVRLGAGAYICGEETSLLNSLEGRRGEVRAKPPLPALQGLFGQPTVVNNVLSLAAVPFILQHGAARYAAYGVERSRGTLPVQLAGNVARGGLYEVPFGMTLRELMMDLGGGTKSGRPLRAVQVGGPLGTYLPESQWDTPLDYEAFAAIGAVLGHAGVVMFDDTVDMAEQARYAMEFCVVESCGKCTPCRIGSVRGVEVIDRIRRNENRPANLALLADLCETMVDGSLCAMGGMTPYPVQSVMRYFADDLHRDRTTEVS